MSSEKKAPEAAATTTEAKCEGLVGTSSPMIDERAARRMREARAWTATNADAWAWSLSRGRACAAEGRKFGMQELSEYIRRHDFTDAHGRRTTIDNSIVPALARLLVAEAPECRPYIEMRTKAYDGLGDGVAGV